MANPTYIQLQKQISDLEAQAAKLKSEEIAGVVARIKEAIAAYELTPQDLFGGRSGAAKVNGKGRGKGKAKASAGAGAGTTSSAKYMDGKGGEWVGRGKRPKWLTDGLAAGKQLEDFLVDKFRSAMDSFASAPADGFASADRGGSRKSGRKSKKSGGKSSSSSSAKYSDGAGNSWSGMGPTPKWLKAAVAGGKAREDFLVKR